MPSEEKLERTRQKALRDIHENILLSQDFVRGLDIEGFVRNKEKIYAVVRWLEIISEASRRLPQDTRERHSPIAWQDISAAGNVYRHDYECLDLREIWNTVQVDLPPLLVAVEEELRRLADQHPS
jgi:uncharacterized protein with HEPN domain